MCSDKLARNYRVATGLTATSRPEPRRRI